MAYFQKELLVDYYADILNQQEPERKTAIEEFWDCWLSGDRFYRGVY